MHSECKLLFFSFPSPMRRLPFCSFEPRFEASLFLLLGAHGREAGRRGAAASAAAGEGSGTAAARPPVPAV
jgi:hypothetical protein